MFFVHFTRVYVFQHFTSIVLLKLSEKPQVGERTDPCGTLSNEKDLKLDFSWHTFWVPSSGKL